VDGLPSSSPANLQPHHQHRHFIKHLEGKAKKIEHLDPEEKKTYKTNYWGKYKKISES